MQHLRRVRRQVDAGEFEIRFIERNVAFGINVTYSDKKLNFITVENNSIIESMRLVKVVIMEATLLLSCDIGFSKSYIENNKSRCQV